MKINADLPTLPVALSPFISIEHVHILLKKGRVNSWNSLTLQFWTNVTETVVNSALCGNFSALDKFRVYFYLEITVRYRKIPIWQTQTDELLNNADAKYLTNQNETEMKSFNHEYNF